MSGSAHHLPPGFAPVLAGGGFKIGPKFGDDAG